MIIDSHQHFWKYDPVKDAWITEAMGKIRKDFLPDDLQPLLKQHDIDGCVTVQAAQNEGENDFMLALARQNSFIKGIVGWVDLRSNVLEERLQHYKAEPVIKGFRHIVQAEPSGFLSQRKFVEGVRRLGYHNFTYDLLIYHHQLPEALSFLSEVREVKIVIDHIAKPSIAAGDIADWEKHMRALSAFENVYCKVSGMVTEADWNNWSYKNFMPYLDVVFNCFGANRIMYGSDWPVCLVAASYSDQLSILTSYVQQLSPAERKLVLGGNAKRFYNL